MNTCNFLFVVCLLSVGMAAARVFPSDQTLADQKNFFSFSGVGSYAGIGSNGMPFGGVGGALGTGGMVGGPPLRAIGGFIGTRPNGGGLTGVGGVYPGGVRTIGGNSGGASVFAPPQP